MSLRSLWPWLLAGALLASAYANFTLYRGRQVPVSAQAPTVSIDPGSIPSFHLTPGASGEHCPTLDQLELTQEQRDQIRSCSLTSLDLRTDLAVDIQAATGELQALLSVDAVDNSLVLELADRISDLRSRQYKAWISSILVVREVLSPEQLQLLHRLESD